MQNFNDLLNGYTDGTKDLSISALTAAGTATFNGSVNLGNATGDDITFTGSLASGIPIKTTNSYNIGSSTLGLASIYFGANSQTVRILGSSSMSATWTLTLPVSAGTSGYGLVTNGSGVTSWDLPILATSTTRGAVDPYSTNGVMYAGTFTPTITAGSNVASGSNTKSWYTRFGKFVTAYCCLAIDATTAATTTNFAISLPISSNLASTSDLVGSLSVYASGVVYPCGYIKGDTGNDRADCYYFAETATPPSREVFAIFSYEIL